MDRIEPESLYDERGTAVSRTRPILQGDVFADVHLPGFGDEPRIVQIVAHPCGMRSGANLTPRITVAPVEPHQAVVRSGWDGNLRVMPLAELADGKSYAAKFVDVTACPADFLTRARRIATLAHQGIYILQQRLIKHYTRVDMQLEVLRRASAVVLTEAELEWDWLDAVLTDAEKEQDAAIDSEARAFGDWLGSGPGSRRESLASEIHHTDLRRQAQRAARERLQRSRYEREDG